MRRSWKSWTASVSGAGSRACYASGTMKPLLTSVCSARRRASRSSLLTKLRTLSSPFEVSGKQINTANSPVIDRFYGANIMFFFPCRVWYLFVFGLPGRNDVVHLCRLTQQVFFLTYVPLLGFNCILLCNLPFCFPSHKGVKSSSTLLVWAPAWSRLSSSSFSFWHAFCQK